MSFLTMGNNPYQGGYFPQSSFGQGGNPPMQMLQMMQTMMTLMMTIMQQQLGGQVGGPGLGALSPGMNPGFGTPGNGCGCAGQLPGFSQFGGNSPFSGGTPYSGGSNAGGPSYGQSAPQAPSYGSPAPSAPTAPLGNAKPVGGGFVSPVDNYRVTSRFGPRKSPTAGASSNHKGIDLAAPLNTPIRAAKAGRVTISKNDGTGYGKWIEIQHADGTKTRYAHLNRSNVQVGAQVQAGQEIGKMGSTGTSTGSHLHFEVLDRSGRKINPESVMKF